MDKSLHLVSLGKPKKLGKQICFVLPKYIIVSELPEDQKDFDASRDFVTNFFQFFHWKC
jgi:hypothetical protein